MNRYAEMRTALYVFGAALLSLFAYYYGWREVELEKWLVVLWLGLDVGILMFAALKTWPDSAATTENADADE